VLTLLMVLALWALIWTKQSSANEPPPPGVPTGELLVSLASVGLIAALTFSGILDAKIAGTLLGAHVGYHAAASKRRQRPVSDRFVAGSQVMECIDGAALLHKPGQRSNARSTAARRGTEVVPTLRMDIVGCGGVVAGRKDTR